jgi:hypothetical protein
MATPIAAGAAALVRQFAYNIVTLSSLFSSSDSFSDIFEKAGILRAFRSKKTLYILRVRSCAR